MMLMGRANFQYSVAPRGDCNYWNSKGFWFIAGSTVGLLSLDATVIPVGPPHKCDVVDGWFRRFKRVFAEEYPKVIASTKRAPGITGGLPTGMSKYRQNTPTAKLMARPIANFMNFLREVGPWILVCRDAPRERLIPTAGIPTYPLGLVVTVTRRAGDRNHVFPLLAPAKCPQHLDLDIPRQARVIAPHHSVVSSRVWGLTGIHDRKPQTCRISSGIRKNQTRRHIS